VDLPKSVVVAPRVAFPSCLTQVDNPDMLVALTLSRSFACVEKELYGKSSPTFKDTGFQEFCPTNMEILRKPFSSNPFALLRRCF